MTLKTEHAKLARREYFRQWRQNNKAAVKQHTEAFYQRQFEKLKASNDSTFDCKNNE